MTNDTKSKKRFDRFFVIILIIAALTALLTFSTTHIAREKQTIEQKQKQLDSVSAKSDTTSIQQ